MLAAAATVMLSDQHCRMCAGHKVRGQPRAGGHTELPPTSLHLILPGPVLNISTVLGRTFYFLINPTMGHLFNSTSCPLSQCLASPSHLRACNGCTIPSFFHKPRDGPDTSQPGLAAWCEGSGQDVCAGLRTSWLPWHFSPTGAGGTTSVHQEADTTGTSRAHCRWALIVRKKHRDPHAQF